MLFRRSSLAYLSAVLAPAAAADALIKVPLRKVPDEVHAAHLLGSRGPARFAAPSSSAAASSRRRLLRGDDPAGTAEDVVLHDVSNAQVRLRTRGARRRCRRGARSALVPRP